MYCIYQTKLSLNFVKIHLKQHKQGPFHSTFTTCKSKPNKITLSWYSISDNIAIFVHMLQQFSCFNIWNFCSNYFLNWGEIKFVTEFELQITNWQWDDPRFRIWRVLNWICPLGIEADFLLLAALSVDSGGFSWWCHDMEMLSTLEALCEGTPTGYQWVPLTKGL